MGENVFVLACLRSRPSLHTGMAPLGVEPSPSLSLQMSSASEFRGACSESVSIASSATEVTKLPGEPPKPRGSSLPSSDHNGKNFPPGGGAPQSVGKSGPQSTFSSKTTPATPVLGAWARNLLTKQPIVANPISHPPARKPSLPASLRRQWFRRFRGLVPEK